MEESPDVRTSFGATWLTSLGSDYEGVLAHAAKDNEPTGRRRVHEEIAQTASPLGTVDGDKLRTGQIIHVASPSPDAGNRLKGSTVCVSNLKITLTAAVQRNLCFKFLPYTPEGESAHWVPVDSPTNLGLDLPRSYKLSNKKASTAVFQRLLSAHS